MDSLIKSKCEINQLFKQLYDAWNMGDAKLYASFFTDNSDYVTFQGIHLKGKSANIEVHEQLFNGILKDSSLHGEITSIRFLSEHIAVVHAVGTVKLSWQKKASANRQSINTNILVKENGSWKISAFHNCRIKGGGLWQKLRLLLTGK